MKSKRILSLLLAMIMLVGMIPANVFAQEARQPYSNEVTQEIASSTDYIFRGDEKLDWDEEEVQSTDTHWPLLEGQRLRKVGRLEPINGFDLNYVGQYTDGEGRDVIRVEVKHFQNTTADGIFQNLQLRFDPALDPLVDWTRSGFITAEGNFVNINKQKDKNNAVNIDYPTIRAGHGTNQQIYHIPLDIVLNEGRSLSELNVDTYVQARLVTVDNKQVMTRAYGDIQSDYSRYTYMAGIPISESKDPFRVGEFKTRMTGADFSYLYNKTANLSVEYSDVKESGLDTGAKTYNGLTFQYYTIAEGVSNVLNGGNYKFAIKLSFDQELADLLKGTRPNEKVGEVILFDQNGNRKSKDHVPLEIQKQNINKDEKTGRSFIVIKPDDSNFELPGINSINVSKSQWKTHVLDVGRNFLRIRLLVDQKGMEDYVNSPKGDSAGSKFLNIDAKMGFIVENPVGWTDFKSTMEKDMSFGNQAFFITEVSEPLHGAGNVTQRNNQIQYKLGSAPNQMVETVQGYFFGANNNIGFRNRIEGITYGGDGGRFFVTNPMALAKHGQKYLHGGRTIKTGEDVTVYIPNVANYGGQVKMWGVDISKPALTTGIYMVPQGDPSVIDIYAPHANIDEAIVTYKNKDNELKEDTLTVRRTPTRRILDGIDNTSGVLHTTGYSNVIATNSLIGFKVDTKNINFSDQDFKIEFFQGSTPKGTITMTQLPEFKKVEKTYKELTYLYNSISEAPFMIGKAHYLPMQSMIFTDDTEFNGYSRFEKARIQLDAINPNTNMNTIAFGTSGHDEYDDEGEIIEKKSFGEEIIYKGKDYRVYPYKIQKPDHIGQMLKDLPLYFSNTDSSSMQSESKIERVRAKVTFDLDGGNVETTEPSYNERKNSTDPIVRIVPDNKYYIDPFTKVLAGEPWKALVYEEKNTDGKATNRLVPALDFDGNQLDYQPNGFAGENIQYLDHNTGQELQGKDLETRKMLSGVESEGAKIFLGWTTRKLGPEDDFSSLEEATTLEQANDKRKAYIFTENTPVDRSMTVYANYIDDPVVIEDPKIDLPDGYSKIEFNPTDQGTFTTSLSVDGEKQDLGKHKVYYVKNDTSWEEAKENGLKISTPIHQSDEYEFEKWTPNLPEDVALITESDIYIASYKETVKVKDVEDLDTPPTDGYVRLTFDAKAGNFGTDSEGQPIKRKAIDVLEGTSYRDSLLTSKLGAIKNDLIPEEGRRFLKWDPLIPATGEVETATFGARYTEAKNLIPAGADDLIPEGYKVIYFHPGNNGKIEDIDGTSQTTRFFIADGTMWGEVKDYILPQVTPNTGYKVNPGLPWSPNIEDETKIVKDYNITALYQELPDVVKAGDGVIQPGGYVTVSFDVKETDAAKGSIKDNVTYYVNPNKEVMLIAPQVEATENYIHTGWDHNPLIAVKYTEDTELNANFEEARDIIPGSEEKPDGYVTITFRHAENGIFRDDALSEKAATQVHVRANHPMTLTAPEIKANTGWKFTGWKGTIIAEPDTTTGDAEAVVIDPETVEIDPETLEDINVSEERDYKENMILIAQYEEYQDLVSANETKPEGYVTVEFTADPQEARLEGSTKYYVNPEKVTDLKTLIAEIEAEGKITPPRIIANPGYKVKDSNWDPDLSGEIAVEKGKEIEIKAQCEFIEDIIPGDQTPPAGFVKVTLVAGEEGKFQDESIEKIFWVKPGTETSKLEKPKANDTKNEFKAWTVAEGQVVPTTIEAETILTASYGGRDFDASQIETIEVTKMPTTVSYTEGDEFDPTGMEITMTDANGNTEVLDADAIEADTSILLSPAQGEVLTNGDNGKVITVTKTVRDENGVKETVTGKSTETITVTPLAATKEPTVNDVKDGATAIKGKAEKGATVTVKLPNGESYTAKADETTGEFTIEVPALEAGQELQVTAKLGDHPESEAEPVTVLTNKEGLEAQVKNADEFADGEGNKVLENLDPNNPIDKALQDAYNKAKEVLENEAATQDAINEAEKALKDAIEEKNRDLNRMAQPTITPAKNGDTKIEGTAEKGSIVEIVLPNGTKTEVTADDEGNWSLDLAQPGLSYNEEITITVKDPQGERKDSQVLVEKVIADLTGLETSNTAALEYDSDEDGKLDNSNKLDPNNPIDKALIDAQEKADQLLNPEEGAEKPSQEAVDKVKKELDEALAAKDAFEELKKTIKDSNAKIGEAKENNKSFDIIEAAEKAVEDGNKLIEKIADPNETVTREEIITAIETIKEAIEKFSYDSIILTTSNIFANQKAIRIETKPGMANIKIEIMRRGEETIVIEGTTTETGVGVIRFINTQPQKGDIIIITASKEGHISSIMRKTIE